MTHLTKTLKAKGMAAFAIGGFMAASLALTPVANAADELPGEGKSVKMARATWDTGYFPAEIYRKALQELGYDVGVPNDLQNPIFYQAVGLGDVDLWVNGWNFFRGHQ